MSTNAKKWNVSFSVSLFLHLAIIMALSYKGVKFQQPKNATKIRSDITIKSYLYNKPKAAVKAEMVIAPKTVKAVDLPKPKQPENKRTIKPTSIKPVIKNTPLKQTKIQIPSTIKQRNTVNYPQHKYLKNLKKYINNNINQKAFIEHKRSKLTSGFGEVMSGKPILVPHSKKQLSQDKKTTMMTSQVSTDTTITKGDDGNCSITQDLTNIGIEGVSATQHFKCGISRFDNNFREHMKKLQTKLAK